MTRRSWWVTGFLATTALAVGAELVAGLDDSATTVPWTDLIVRYIPAPITYAAIAALVVWLPIHFIPKYQHRSKEAVMATTEPVPAPNPTDRRKEPLLKRAGLMATVTAVMGLLISFNVVHLTDTQQGLVLTAIGGAATMIAAWWARRHVYPPNSVNKLLSTARARLQR